MRDKNEECFAHLGTSRTGGTRRTKNSSNSQNLSLPGSSSAPPAKFKQSSVAPVPHVSLVGIVLRVSA